jgi:hypothetical protein
MHLGGCISGPQERGFSLWLSFCRANAPRWNMVEIFLLGVLVCLLKLGNLITLTLGPSFWAVVGLTACLIAAVAHRPRRPVGTTGGGAAMTEFDIGGTLEPKGIFGTAEPHHRRTQRTFQNSRSKPKKVTLSISKRSNKT